MKVPNQSQQDAAERLSKGLSVAEQQHKYLKIRNKSSITKAIHPSIVIDQRPYIPINTINITNEAFSGLYNSSPANNAGINGNAAINNTLNISGANSNSNNVATLHYGAARGIALTEKMNQNSFNNPNELWSPMSAKESSYNGSVLRQQMFRFENNKKEQGQLNCIGGKPSNYLGGHPFRTSDNMLMAQVSNLFGISDKVIDAPNDSIVTVKDTPFKQLFPVWFNK